MSFHPIILTAPTPATYNEAGRGKYILSSSVFGGVQEYFKLSPFTRNKASGTNSGSIQLYTEYDDTVGSVVTRHFERVILTVELSAKGRVSQVDNNLIRLNEFINSANLNRWTQGEF